MTHQPSQPARSEAKRKAGAVVPITRSAARACVQKWHSHHRPHVGETLSLGWTVDGDVVACVVLGRPSARALDNGITWEVTRLCIGPDAPRFCASRLLGAASRAAEACGVRRLISYTRADESGTCYRAAGWWVTATVSGSPWTHGAKATRWLPGLYEPSTEIVDRLRWERGKGADRPMVGEAADRYNRILEELGVRRGGEPIEPGEG